MFDWFGRVAAPNVLPLVVVVVLAGVLLWVLQRWSLRVRSVSHSRVWFGLSQIMLSLVAMVAFIMVLPIDEQRRGQILSLLGILISAAIAFSSTTLIGNLMAGFALHNIRSFRRGDFLRVEDYFGRVTEQELLHTEIQTEDRDLLTFPNLYLLTKPLQVIRRSGTIISATVSLGYEVSRFDVERALIAAAQGCELEDPFVRVSELGDYSVVYRIAGLLKDLNQVISKRSELRKAMMDALHEANIEITSPTFMNTRQFPEDTSFVGPVESPKQPGSVAPPEEIMFDKGNEAASLEELVRNFEKLQQWQKGPACSTEGAIRRRTRGFTAARRAGGAAYAATARGNRNTGRSGQEPRSR